MYPFQGSKPSRPQERNWINLRHQLPTHPTLLASMWSVLDVVARVAIPLNARQRTYNIVRIESNSKVDHALEVGQNPPIGDGNDGSDDCCI